MDGLNQTKRRGRGPSPDKTAETRRVLVAAALDAFVERGFSDTRMSDVADRAKLAKGTLYLHFDDKEALFEGVLRHVITDAIASVTSMSPLPGETVRAFLVRTVLPILRDLEVTRRADVIRLVLAEGARFQQIAETYRRLMLHPLMAFIQALSVRALAQGELRTDTLTRFPLLLMAPGLLATIWNGMYGSDERIDTGAMFEAYLDLIFVPPET